MYSDYVMYYKPSLKHYYYFRVCFNKYYCLLKKELLPFNRIEEVNCSMGLKMEKSLYKVKTKEKKIMTTIDVILVID